MQDLEINLIEVTKKNINDDAPYEPHIPYVHPITYLNFLLILEHLAIKKDRPFLYLNILIFWISSKFLKSLSVIYSLYLKGSDRPYHLPNMFLRRTRKNL